jgi:pre-mRNA-processing factor 19
MPSRAGSYLAVAGADLRVFAGRTLTHVKTFTEHAGPVTGVVWGEDAKFLASCSTDRTLRFWASE